MADRHPLTSYPTPVTSSNNPTLPPVFLRMVTDCTLTKLCPRPTTGTFTGVYKPSPKPRLGQADWTSGYLWLGRVH